MYILYLFAQDYDEVNMRILACSPNQIVLEKIKENYIALCKEEQNNIKEYNKNRAEFNKNQIKQLKIFLEKNRNALRDIRKKKLSGGRLCATAFAVAEPPIKLSPKQWKELSDFEKKLAEDTVIDLAIHNWWDFTKKDGWERYLIPEKLDTTPLVLKEKFDNYPTTKYDDYHPNHLIIERVDYYE